MIAAKTNSKEVIDWLLEKQANPNFANSKLYTALSYAILSGNIEIVKKLFKITTKYLDVSLELLANSLIKLDQPLRRILNKLIKANEELYFPFLKNCSEFGNHDFYEMLVEDHNDLFMKLDLPSIKELIRNNIVSDVFDACRVASKYFTEEQRKFAIECAKERNKAKMVKLLCGEELLQETEPGKTSDIFQRVVKCEEFPLFNNLSKIINQWLSDRTDDKVWIKLTELLKEMKAPEVHYNGDCPEDCTQEKNCRRVCDSKELVLDLLNRIAVTVPIFGDPEVHVVGSMKEMTKEMSRHKCINRYFWFYFQRP